MAAVEEATLPVRVHKFGGTSVATTSRIKNAVSLLLEDGEDARLVVVVSALGGVTDLLIGAIDEAISRSGKHRQVIDEIAARHARVLTEIVGDAESERGAAALDALWHDLEELLDGVFLLRECTPRTRDAVLSIGERASIQVFSAAVRAAGREAVGLDATAFVVTDDTFGDAGVLFDETNPAIRETFARIDPSHIGVVTGFIGATRRGVITTLGRSGSDYTATIVGAALDAERVIIWTDVDGVLSADPRLVPEAFSLPELSYREAAELAFFGAKVLHPRTMRPVQVPGIPLFIRNTLNPQAEGTCISSHGTRDGFVKAVTTIRNVSVVMLEGTGFIGVPGISARALGALAAKGINILMISQASSEQSLCAVVAERDAEAAVNAMRSAFEWELERGDVSRIYYRSGCAVLSVVGDRMRDRPGLAGQMFSTLGRNGVNVLAIAQGASETNISAVVRDEEVRQAVRALHETFALSHDQAHVFLMGTGVVGRALLDILAHQTAVLQHESNIRIKLVGIADSRRSIWNPDGIPFHQAMAQLEEGEESDLDDVIARLKEKHLERLILVDATASSQVAHRYPELIEKHVAIVTPNKRSNTLDMAFYERLHELAAKHRVPYLYETTVGAGLPVVSTLRDLLRSGDEIIRIEGVFSGTLSYVFNHLSEGRKFSEIVREAREMGFTEPDPRDDLKGEDVARKLLILAREMGLRVERSDVAVESLVAPEHLEMDLDEYLAQIEEADEQWDQRVEAAAGRGSRLQYIGMIDGDRLTVRTRTVDATSPFAHLQGTNCLILFKTMRYFDNPLVVQGPGAGPAVTAAGLVAEIIRAIELSR